MFVWRFVLLYASHSNDHWQFLCRHANNSVGLRCINYCMRLSPHITVYIVWLYLLHVWDPPFGIVRISYMQKVVTNKINCYDVDECCSGHSPTCLLLQYPRSLSWLHYAFPYCILCTKAPIVFSLLQKTFFASVCILSGKHVWRVKWYRINLIHRI